MKLSFGLGNAKQLKSLFSEKRDFLDVYTDGNLLILFSNTQELFTYAYYAIGHCDVPNIKLNFRVPREGFLSLIDNGIVSILVEETEILLRLEIKDCSHTIKFPRQTCNTVEMLEKFELMNKSQEYPSISLTDLMLITRLSRTSRLPIAIDSGIASIVLGPLIVFSRTKCPDMALFPVSFWQFLSLMPKGGVAHSIENYLVCKGPDYGIAVTKAISFGNNDYDYVRRQKELESVEVDFSSASSLLSKIRRYSTASLNLNTKSLVLEASGVEFITSVLVSGSTDDSLSDFELITKGNWLREFPVVSFPESVFKQIIYLAKSKKLNISFTKTLIRMKISENTMLVCRRNL